jgi:nickel transport protein
MKPTNRPVKVVFLILVMMALLTGTAFAHRITIVGWVEGDTVYLEGYFSGGTVPKDALIQVSDPDGNILHEGRTDDNGEHSFKVPGMFTLTVLIDAGAGHQATCEIPEDEIRQEAALLQQASGGDGSSAGGVALDETVLRAIIASEVGKQMKQFSRDMNTGGGHGGPAVTDILGGIGYVIGLVGLGAYIHYRRKSRPEKKG